MAVEFPAVSFVWAGVFAMFIPVRRIRMSVPNLAIVLWLVAYNVIRGINAIVWAGNVDIHVPVWCDIATKLMLGANIALPGAFLCVSRQLELISSPRKISLEKNAIRNRTILELVFCYMIPIIYMSLHLVAQDHRFDLVKDLGCSASIHPSTFAFLIIWIPPLILCSISLFLSGLSIHHACRQNSTRFSLHLESRSTMTSSIFVRRLVICMSMSGTLALVSIFSVFSVPEFVPWVSWDSVHARISQINIVAVHDDVKVIQIAWWGVFAVSAIYIILTVGLGEETRDAFRWVREQLTKKRELPRLVLPVYNSKMAMPEMVSRSSSLTKPNLRPLSLAVDLELKSGWDDMLDNKSPKRKNSSRRNSRSPIQSSSRSSPTISTRSVAEDDQAFMESTISYLGSPTAKTLGISSPLHVPPPAMTPPPRAAFEIPPKPASPPPHAPSQHLRTSRPIPATVPIDAVPPTITSVFQASWPVPPASPTPSLSLSRHGSGSRAASSHARSIHSTHTNSRSNSPTSSMDDSAPSTFGYPLYPTITPPHLRTRPFEGSSICSVGDLPPSSPKPVSPASPTSKGSKGSLKSALKKPSIKNIRRSWSKERIGQSGYGAGEVILMTVVQETV